MNAQGPGVVRGTRLSGNRAERSGDDGFDVRSAGTTIKLNAARSNTDYDIVDVRGVTDGGHNRASQNGNQAQCRNFTCRYSRPASAAPTAARAAWGARLMPRSALQATRTKRRPQVRPALRWLLTRSSAQTSHGRCRPRVNAQGAARAAPPYLSKPPRHIGAIMSAGLSTWHRRLAPTAKILLLSALAAAAAATTGPAGPATAATPQPTLVGRAVLPVDTFAEGPAAGNFVVPGPGTVNGVTFPLRSQPVQGFSALIAGRGRGEYLAMPDNGFGGKANSRDFLIRAYYVRPHFKTAAGGTGAVQVGPFISFRDPHHLIGFPIVNEGTPGRLLTGGDIDPESLQRGHHGDLWVGDEFGPWILHFDRSGVLLDPPFALPGGLMSPNNPFLNGQPSTQPNSRGLEGMAITANHKFLYAGLEGATVADTDTSRRYVFEFSTRSRAFTGRVLQYRTEAAGNLVSDMSALDNNRLVVLERDAGSGLNALFRRAYLIDLRSTDPAGFLKKTLLVDLASIPDPGLVSLPAIHPGDVGLGNPFRVTCESVEAVHPIGDGRLVIGCDNNFPNSGRNPGLPDDNEFIVVARRGLPCKG